MYINNSFLFVFSCLLNWKKHKHTFILKGKEERLKIEAKSGVLEGDTKGVYRGSNPKHRERMCLNHRRNL